MSDFDTLAAIVEVAENLIPFNRILGVRDARIDEDGTVQIRVDNRPELLGNFARGYLHGGVISATLDVVGGIAAMLGVVGRELPATMEEAGRIFSKIGTIDMRIDYLRPGVGDWFDASAVVLRTGSRVAVTRMEFHNDRGTLIAVGTGTYIVG
jgi:uncharacterized protein (TIGR00369 family)